MSRSLLPFALLMALPCAAQPVTVEIDMAPLLADNLVLTEGAEIGVRGDTAPLAWDRSLPLTDEDGDGIYATTLDFPDGTGLVEYKAVVQAPDGELLWEPGDNRVLVPGRMDADRRAFSSPQTSLPVRTVSSRQLGEDLALFRNALLALHPGLFLHNTETELERASNRLAGQARALAQRYGEAIPVSEVYLMMSEAIAAIRDGHTQLNPYNQAAYTRATLFAQADRVPFAFRLVGDRMIVTGDATPSMALPTGTEVLSLDGQLISDVIETLMAYMSADGSNDGKRRNLLSVTGLPPAEAFDIVYALRYQPEGTLDLQLRLPDGTEADLTVPLVTRDARRATLLERNPTLPRSDDDLLQFRILEDDTAYLYIGSFATFQMETDYAAWLTGAFRQMNERGAERLVVDLRGTPGGMDEAAALLFSHLLQEPVEVDFWSSTTAYDRMPDALRPHVRSWTSDFYDLTDRVTPNGDGTFSLRARPPITVAPAPDAFRGRVAVLVDAAASSATFYLARQIKRTGAALLVGQETGGNLRGLNGGQIGFLTLPETGLVVDIPLFGSRPPEPGEDRGVLPDVLVEPDADAVIAGRDPELEAALAALRSH
ncbi:MAG: hypothetical protein HKN04_03765 [Rhodothermaceae bacterium]|nr:hypothetical protein [Rhodothermaceae bacterium]